MRSGADHVGEVKEGDGAEFLVSLGKHLPGIVGEAPVAIHVGGVHPSDLLDQPGLIGDVVKRYTIAPLEAVEGSHRQQADILGQLPAGEREQLLQAVRRGDHGRPGIEDVAPLLVDGRPTARLVMGLVADRLEAHRLEADRRCEAAKPAPDHRRPAMRRSLRPRRTGPGDRRQAHGNAPALVGSLAIRSASQTAASGPVSRAPPVAAASRSMARSRRTLIAATARP